MNPAFRWNVFGQWGSLTCGLEVMTTSSSRHGRKGDLSITVVLAQLLTMAKIPGSKTTKGIQDAQISLQVCVFSCDKALSCFCDPLVSLCGLGVIGLTHRWNSPNRFVHFFCHKLKLKNKTKKCNTVTQWIHSNITVTLVTLSGLQRSHFASKWY